MPEETFNDTPESEDAFRVKGTFLGQPIDVTLAPVDAECFSEPPVQDLTREAEAAGVDTTDKDCGEPGAAEVTTPADPAPEVKDVSDEPKNPAGNAEQL